MVRLMAVVGRALVVLVTMAFVALALAWVWEGAENRCEPGSGAATVATLISVGLLVLAAVSSVLAVRFVGGLQRLSWWAASAVGYVVLLLLEIVHFATACSA
jgi:hypothetical protein